MSGKRKRVFVSLGTKLSVIIIERLDSGESIKNLAADFGAGEVTVCD